MRIALNQQVSLNCGITAILEQKSLFLLIIGGEVVERCLFLSIKINTNY
jgi:hypothetical protein